ncbi:MAG: hypothetical protein AAB581_01565 [Patescibacteria group bacterium]
MFYDKRDLIMGRDQVCALARNATEDALCKIRLLFRPKLRSVRYEVHMEQNRCSVRMEVYPSFFSIEPVVESIVHIYWSSGVPFVYFTELRTSQDIYQFYWEENGKMWDKFHFVRTLAESE